MQLRRVAEHLQRRGGQLRLGADPGVERAAPSVERSASASLRSVMSRKFITRARTLGSSSRLLTVFSIQRHDPSLWRTIVSTVTTFPGECIIWERRLLVASTWSG